MTKEEKKRRRKEAEDYKMAEVIKTVIVVTSVRCIGGVLLTVANVSCIFIWYWAFTSTIKAFIGWYVFVGGLVNCLVLLAHGLWEEWYTTRRADKIHSMLSKMKEIAQQQVELEAVAAEQKEADGDQ